MGLFRKDQPGEIKFPNFRFLVFTVILVMMIAGIGKVFVSIKNNRAATEKRAYEMAQNHAEKFNIKAKRLTCAGDSQGDGYATCTIIAEDGEKIILNCPVDWFDTRFWGVTSCKEMTGNMIISGSGPAVPAN